MVSTPFSTPFTSHYPIRFAHTDMAGIVYYPLLFINSAPAKIKQIHSTNNPM